VQKKPLNRLKAVLKEKGKSQAWLAEKLGVGVVTVSRYVNEHRQMSLVELHRIAKILGIPGKDLINF
jgi:putative transcriptional regulator